MSSSKQTVRLFSALLAAVMLADCNLNVPFVPLF